jgi:hypothetical protein
MDNENPIDATGHGGNDPTQGDPEVPTQETPDENGPQPAITDDELTHVRCFKISTGENVIAILVGIENGAIVVKHPAKIVQFAQEDGRAGVALFKWQPYSEAEYHIVAKIHIVATSSASKQMTDYYKKSVLESIEEDKQEFVWPKWMDEEVPKNKLN